MFRFIIAALLAVTLSACEDAETKIKIGAKNFGESRILAHMMAELAKEQGVPVAGVVDYESTQAIQQALKRGDIDAYPEYNGTGLVMLGQNPMSDGDAATERVKELYEPLGMSWRPRLGFANNYGLAMRADRAAELELATMSELASRADALTIGVEDDFIRRPLDGYQPMVQRYGFDFGGREVVPLSDRGQLYDMLLDGDVDVIEVYTTDGQIADYGLTILEDDQEFFPVYEAAILARAASLSAHDGLGGAFDALAGKIDGALMQELNGKVDIEGRSPDAIARDALARIGLLDSGAVETEDPLLIAASPFIGDGAAASVALRAARAAFEGRDIQIQPSHTPLSSVADGSARLALVGADTFFDISSPAPVRMDSYEAVANVGQNLVHVVTTQLGPTNLDKVETLATGPEGSSSHQIGSILTSGLSLSGSLAPGDAADVAALIARVTGGDADAAVIPAPEGDNALLAAFSENDLRLIPIRGWNEGANLVRFPFLRQTQIGSGVYRGQFGAVETLGAQLVLAGPAPDASEVVGDQGPSAVAVGLSPISGSAVNALNEALPETTLIDPTLQQAAALAPALPEPPAAINPAADISLLNLAIVLLFVWLIWLYTRPEYR